MVYAGNNFYAVEGNGGQLVKITTSGIISRVSDLSASQGHIVPTVVQYHKGNFIVGNLNVFPIVPGSSKIYKITPGGQVSIIASEFTTILGIAFDKKDRLYVLENTVGPPFPTPGTGRIVRLDQGGNKKTIVSNLSLPIGMTFRPDEKL